MTATQPALPLTDPNHTAPWETTQEHDEPGWWDGNGREHTITVIDVQEGRL